MVQLIQLWWSDSYEKVSSQGCGCASFPISCCMVLPKQVWNLRQQMRETVTRYFTVILPNTMISFWNISTASAPIQPTEARVKYWMNSDMMVQPASVSVRSIPTRKNSSIPNMAIHSCAWNLLASRWRSFLHKVKQIRKWNVHCFLSCFSACIYREVYAGYWTVQLNKCTHLNPTIVMRVRINPIIEIMEPTILKASRALLSTRPAIRALISCTM